MVLTSYPVYFCDWNSMISTPTLINVVILLRSFPTRYWWKMKGGAIHESNPLSTWPCSLKPASKVSLKNLASFYRNCRPSLFSIETNFSGPTVKSLHEGSTQYGPTKSISKAILSCHCFGMHLSNLFVAQSLGVHILSAILQCIIKG